MIKRLVILVGFGLVVLGCDDEYKFQQSLFIQDKDHPGLPRYSELGYNTFGAYYDREVFKSSWGVPMDVLSEGGVTSITLSGELGLKSMSIILIMNDFAPDEYTDLIGLHDKNIDVTNSNNYTVQVYLDETLEEAEILEGTFHFKRAQNLILDKRQIGVILSGTFEFRAIINGQPVTVSDGRFDVNIGENNFYFI